MPKEKDITHVTPGTKSILCTPGQQSILHFFDHIEAADKAEEIDYLFYTLLFYADPDHYDQAAAHTAYQLRDMLKELEEEQKRFEEWQEKKSYLEIIKD